MIILGVLLNSFHSFMVWFLCLESGAIHVQRIVSRDLMAAILVGARNGDHLLPRDILLRIEAPCRLPLIKSLNKDDYYDNWNAILQ